MSGEIDKDFYCSANCYETTECFRQIAEDRRYCDEGKKECGCYHRKHPTVFQYKEEYGEDVPDDMAVYCFTFDGAGYSWVTGDYKWAKEYRQDFEPIVVACTPFPKPDWRPEEATK